MAFKNYRDESRRNWGRTTEGELEHDDLSFGALLRIADAAELMAQNHATLLQERDNYQRWYREEKEKKCALERRVNSLRGAITLLKKKLARAVGQ